MKILNDILYIEFSEMVECGVSEKYLWKAKSTGTKCWEFVDDPTDKRKVLIAYESLKDQYKKMVQARYGNPYEYVAKEPIKKLVEKDFKAEEYFLKYRFDDNKSLGIEYVNKYTTSVSWLNMLLKLNQDKKFIKKTLGLSLESFYTNVCDLIRTLQIDLPTSYKRLRMKMDEYQEKGYESIIDWRFGNKLAAKIGKSENGFDGELAEKQTAAIRKLASMHMNFDAVQITRYANMLFEQQGWPTISDGTVKNIIAKNQHIITPGKLGQRIYNSNIAMQVTRKRPDYPLYYWCLDGWTVELLYQEERDGRMTYNNRLVMVVVIDVMNNYPVGYAIGERENAELIRQANRNAIIHMSELFGEYYRPWQLQSDNYAKKTMTSFYEAMTQLYTPAAVGNAKSKVIEPYFNEINSKYFQTQFNWSGHNVTSKKSNQPNIEFLDKIKKTFPDKSGVIDQINMIMTEERKQKVEAFVERFSEMPAEDKVALERRDMLMIFGKQHTHLNSITGQGIIATIEGTQFTFDSFDPAFRANQHLKWQLIYDENDFTQVLAVNAENNLEFILDQKRILPMSVKEMTQDDHDHLSRIKEYNSKRREEIISTYITDGDVMQELVDSSPLQLNNFTEASLKLMFTDKGQQKESLQDAKGLIAAKKKVLQVEQKQELEVVANWQSQQLNYLESKTNYNQYLD